MIKVSRHHGILQGIVILCFGNFFVKESERIEEADIGFDAIIVFQDLHQVDKIHAHGNRFQFVEFIGPFQNLDVVFAPNIDCRLVKIDDVLQTIVEGAKRYRILEIAFFKIEKLIGSEVQTRMAFGFD